MNLCRLSLQTGNTYALLSASGSGKSVLLSLLCGFPPRCWHSHFEWDPRKVFGWHHRIEWSSWTVFGKPVPSPRHAKHKILRTALFAVPENTTLIYLPQNFPTDRSETIQAGDAMSFLYRAALPHASPKTARAAVHAMLPLCGMQAKVLQQPLAQLSGGERRRLELQVRLKTLMDRSAQHGIGQRPAALVLLDEPTSGLDAHNERKFIASIVALHENFPDLDLAVLMSTHAFAMLTPESQFFSGVVILDRDEPDSVITLVYQGAANDAFSHFSSFRKGQHVSTPITKWWQVIDLLETTSSEELERHFLKSQNGQ
jgi:ABC-type multidrug transport system ATPase subunit